VRIKGDGIMTGPLIFIGILLTLACAVAAIYFMKVYYKKDYKLSVMLKGLAGIFFVLFGLVKVIASVNSLSWPIALVALALLFGLAGDELLALRHIYNEKYTFYFVIGALCFGAEHVLLMTSVLIDNIKLVNPLILFIMFGIAFVISLVYLKTRKTDAGSIQKSAIFYISLLSLMCSMMITRGITAPTLPNLLMALGGVFFIVSDNVLLVYNFGEKRDWWLNEIVHIAYYGAQILFGWALLAR
jgi:uncharacterized membrane protein YhhN